MKTDGAFRAAVAAAALAGAALAPSTAAAATDESADAPAAVPYRPSVSAPAALSAPGWLEVEAGFAYEHGTEGARRQSVPYTFKLAFSPDWGVRVGGEAWARQRAAGSSDSGFGDLGVVVKRRFVLDDDQALGVEAGVVLPSGRRAVRSGSGKADYAIAGIYSADADAWHVDANLIGTRLGQVEPRSSRFELLYALAVSRSLSERLGVVAEVSGTQRHGAEATRQLLAAASFALDKRLVLDVGAARSLRRAAPEWSAFAGLTWTAMRLFDATP